MPTADDENNECGKRASEKGVTINKPHLKNE
jgi:hypothetical protein